MSATRAILVTTLGAASIFAAYLLAFAPAMRVAGAWAMALGLALLCAGLIALTARGALPRRGLLRATLVLLPLTLAAGFGYGLLRPDDDALLLGLPRATTVMLLLVEFVPLICLPVVYALTFDDR